MSRHATCGRRRWTAVLISLLLASVLPMNLAFAQVPQLIRYQGQAVDSQGVPLEGPYTLTFRLYDAATAGALLWQEQQSVTLSKGHFSVLLGQQNPLTSIDWSQPRWISIQVGTQPELSPRQQFTSVPLALRAQVAEGLVTPVTTSTITDDANKLMPAGAIILWDGASCPSGYTRLATYDNKFLVAASTPGSSGGSNTHGHGAGSYAGPSHTHTVSSKGWGTPTVVDTSNPPGWIRLMNAGSWGGSIDGALDTNKTTSTSGTGPVTGTSAATDSRPEYLTILLCKKN